MTELPKYFHNNLIIGEYGSRSTMSFAILHFAAVFHQIPPKPNNVQFLCISNSEIDPEFFGIQIEKKISTSIIKNSGNSTISK